MKHKRRKSISDRIAEEFIDEIMMAGLAFLLVVAGVNYFNMKWAWTEILGKAAAGAGLTGTTAGAEVTRMLASLAQTFPFKYLFAQYDFWGALAIAIILTTAGIMLKAFTVRTKGKFIIDIGKNIYVPAIIGLVVIVILQLWTAFNVDDYITTNQLARPEFATGYFIWNTYGQLFLLGASLLVIGAIVKLVGEKNDSKKSILVGDTMFNGAIILIIYYVIIRIMALELFIYSDIGKVMKLFIISTQYANFTIIVCIFMFTFGRALKRYGLHVLKHERREHQIAKFKHEYEMGKSHVQRPHSAQPGHPGQLHVSEGYHLRHKTQHPAYNIPDHPVHRYVEPTGRYKRKPKN